MASETPIPIPPAVTAERFREWRSRRFGRANPEPMDNPVWEWLIETRLDAYSANRRLDGPDPLEAGPCWCFQRFGQSSTELPDGRIVLIAGEHEDSYDADFCIYNDVVVKHPDGEIDIYGYPRDVFPPTDFHSATLVGDRVVIIGSIGYVDDRRPGVTPVAVLDLATFAISTVTETSGSPPGWISRHSAELSEDGTSILVRGGQLVRGGPRDPLVENIDDWRLHLADWRWERLTDRRWPRWEMRRRDRGMLHVWEIFRAAFARDARWTDEYEGLITKLKEATGARPDLDVADRLFSPGVSHARIPDDEDEYRVRRIRIGDVIVRYVEDMMGMQMTVEGELPAETLDALVDDLRVKLEALENAPVDVLRLE